jgi:hypothetical protein
LIIYEVPLALDFFKTTHDQNSYNLHCWRELKDYEKWKLTYDDYKRRLKNGNASVIVDLEEEDENKGVILDRPRGK